MKYISRAELNMFLEYVMCIDLVSILSLSHAILSCRYARSYFAYMAKTCFHGLPSVLIKLLGLSYLTYFCPFSACFRHLVLFFAGLFHVSFKREGRKEKMNKFMLVMPNLFYDREVSQVFDLKGSARNRYIKLQVTEKNEHRKAEDLSSLHEKRRVLLDQNFMECRKP